MTRPDTGTQHNAWAWDDALREGSLPLYKLQEAATETLAAIEEMAVLMMSGKRYKRELNGRQAEYSLRTSGFQDDASYWPIMESKAEGVGEAADIFLCALMKRYCRFTAAGFLDYVDIDVLEANAAGRVDDHAA